MARLAHPAPEHLVRRLRVVTVVVAERLFVHTWELTPMGATTLLRMTHDDFDGETVTYQSISQGWAPILNSLKSFIETGEALNLAEIG